jgi:AcrR family transcriptional regulator
VNEVRQDPVDQTGERILDAAMAAMLKFGIRRTSVEAIARQAGISHMTIYRRWPRKQDLYLALLAREAQRLFARVDREIERLDTTEEKLLAGFTSIFSYFHTHPLLGRELETEPESVLPALTLGADPIIQTCKTYLAGHIRAMGGRTIQHADALAELLVRVAHSLILAPPRQPRLESTSDIREYARCYFLPLVSGLATQV